MDKQHEYILKAFLEAKIPKAIRRNSPELMVIDSVLGGYCTRLLKGTDPINQIVFPLISKEDKNGFSNLINITSGAEKDDLVFYYRLAILTEAVIFQYQQIMGV